MALTDNLVSYWTLDEASGTRADSHASNNLSDHNTVGSGTGIINGGADFESGNSESLHITTASQTGLDFTGDISISCWLNPESLANTRTITSYRQAAGNDKGHNFDQRSSGEFRAIYFDGAGNSRSITSNTGISTGSLQHLVITVDVSAGTAVFYLDNSSMGTASTAGTATAMAAPDGSFIMGGNSVVGNDPYDGVIDEFGIWNRILTAGEVSDLYNAGAGLAYPLSTTTFTPKITIY